MRLRKMGLENLIINVDGRHPNVLFGSLSIFPSASAIICAIQFWFNLTWALFIAECKEVYFVAINCTGIISVP